MAIGGKENVKTKLVRSRLKWVGNVGRMGDGQLAANREDAQKVEEKRR